MNIVEKIISSHLVSGELKQGSEIGLRMDQTLTQDATGTMAYLEFEAMGVPRVKTELSVAYIDHNTLQSGFENADDHRYIRTAAQKYGLYFSRPGNGICHQVHLERFGIPGKTLIGSDSHTPTAGGLGMLAFGAGGLDVAVAMGGGEYRINMPKVIKVELSGSLPYMVGAKDVILYILSLLSVKGGVGYIMEYGGEGVKNLSVTERATITNMGAELGASTSVFPSDERTKEFLESQGRGDTYVPVFADEDAVYDKIIKVDLSSLVPLAACPHSPDNVRRISELKGRKIDQVCIGSCTNSSLSDMLKVAAILKGKTVADNVSLTISPGSRQVLTMLASCGALADMTAAGARLLECTCGPCIGMGQSPESAGVSLRTFNRNFEGRSGTKDASVYLVSPETAAASAVAGVFCDPTELSGISVLPMPDKFLVNDNMIIPPLDETEAEDCVVLRGPNIKPFPVGVPAEDNYCGSVLLKVGDNITTDHIMPAGAKILPYRSNIPYLSRFCFAACDEEFALRAEKNGGGIIVGGENYGQGSSREHAALVPLYLGVRAVIAKSFARIHKANLVNAGIIPFTFADASDYELVSQAENVAVSGILSGSPELVTSDGTSIKLTLDVSPLQMAILREGGLINYTKGH